jgi:glucose/arabinose dehydrogenase
LGKPLLTEFGIGQHAHLWEPQPGWQLPVNPPPEDDPAPDELELEELEPELEEPRPDELEPLDELPPLDEVAPASLDAPPASLDELLLPPDDDPLPDDDPPPSTDPPPDEELLVAPVPLEDPAEPPLLEEGGPAPLSPPKPVPTLEEPPHAAITDAHAKPAPTERRHMMTATFLPSSRNGSARARSAHRRGSRPSLEKRVMVSVWCFHRQRPNHQVGRIHPMNDIGQKFAMKTEERVLLLLAALACGAVSGGCSSEARIVPPGPLPPVPAGEMPAAGSFCALPGSVVQTSVGPALVGGADAGGVPDLGWLTLPKGFCAHVFANTGVARQLRFAPGGELFVASPQRGTTGAKPGGGQSAILVLPDDDHDGMADSVGTFLGGLAAVQGLLFAGGQLYYQDAAVIRSLAYNTGDRQPSGAAEVATDMSSLPQDSTHWPKVFDRAMDGTIYISNGGGQLDVCLSTSPLRGAIMELNADGTTTEVAKGFRNPIAIRCESNHDVCLAIELALDFSAEVGGREKLLPIHAGDDWGFPCCATQNTPYSGVLCQDTNAMPDCSGVAAESGAFVIGDTPFGLDFETGQWPEPWGGRAFVTLHGDYQSWKGARVVAIALDPTTGLPLPSSELPGSNADPNDMLEFASGWDDGRQDHGRPAPITFAPDGRLFLGNDWTGTVVWIAPVGLMRP